MGWHSESLAGSDTITFHEKNTTLFNHVNSTEFFDKDLYRGDDDNVTQSSNFTGIEDIDTSLQSSGTEDTAVRYFPWENPLNIMTKKISDDITSALQCIVFPVITAVGILGSILSLIVLFQKNLRNSTTSIVLIGLAFSDLCFLVTNFVRKSTCIFKEYDQLLADEINATTFFYMFYLKTSFSRVSTLIVVLISVERLIAVAFPLKVKQIVTKKRMIASVMSIYALVFGSLSALPLQYTYTYIRGKPYISQTKFATENAVPLKAYNEYFLPIVFRYIPVIIVITLNTVIIYLVRQSKRFQNTVGKQDQKRKDEQRKITRMLLSVAIIFLICLLPGDLLLLCSSTIDGFEFFGTYHNLFMVLSDLCLMFEMINSSVNFITYMILNRNFYDTYVRLFCCCRNTIRMRRSPSSKPKSLDTKESSLNSKMKGFKDNGMGSGIEEKSQTENEASSAPVNGLVNQGYLE